MKSDSVKDSFIKLRAHHGMCLAFFEGKGYSDGFCAHMQSVLNMLQDNPEIQVVTESDLICSKCPNLQNGICTTPDLVKQYDTRVLSLCGLTENTRLTWEEFSALITDNILSCKKRKSICGSCQWNDICSSKEQIYHH